MTGGLTFWAPSVFVIIMPFISEDCSQAYKFAAQEERGRYNSPKLNDFQIWGILHNIHSVAAIRDVADTPDIKVITGVRRSGKSKLMETLSQALLDD